METYNTTTIYSFSKETYPNFKLGTLRAINTKHADDLMRAYIVAPLYIPPVVVNLVTNTLIDGGHRFSAIKKAWDSGVEVPIRVVFVNIPKEDERKTIIAMNCGSKTWTMNDYINDLITNSHNEDAIRLRDFALSHKRLYKDTRKGRVANYRYASAVLKGINQHKEIINGTISVTTDDIIRGNKFFVQLDSILDRMDIKGTNPSYEGFACAWYDLMMNNQTFADCVNKIDWETYLKCFKMLYKEVGLNGGKGSWLKRFEKALDEAIAWNA